MQGGRHRVQFLWYAANRTLQLKGGEGYLRTQPFEKVLRAINIQTGEVAWELPQVSGTLTSSAGTLSTASGLVFFGENSGSFMAADASNGKVLWDFPTNQAWKSSPMTYMFDNKQYIAIAVFVVGILVMRARGGPAARPDPNAVAAAGQTSAPVTSAKLRP